MSTTKVFAKLVVFVLIIFLAACNLPSRINVNPPPEDQSQLAADAVENEPVSGLQPEPVSEPAADTQSEPAAQLPAFNIADLCSVVSPAVAEQILGQPVEAVEGPGACLYSNGTASITVSALDSEAAKLSLAGQVLQLEEDCSMSFSFSSDQPDPTPLPPEADPLLALGLPDLMAKSLDLQQSCGGPEYEDLAEYGPGVYLLPFELFMPGGQVSIVTEDYTLTILYTDLNAETSAAVETARQILELITAGQ